MKKLLAQQYEYVKSSRAVLLDYCAVIDNTLFTREVEGFGRGGSIRNLLVHINNTYQHWAGYHCLGRIMSLNEYHNYPDLQSCSELFAVSNALVDEMLERFQYNMLQDIERDGVSASPFRIFTHIFTHEYHHKGQILSISRLLGCTPIDTDIVR